MKIQECALNLSYLLSVIILTSMHEQPTLQHLWVQEVHSPAPLDNSLWHDDHIVFVAGLFNELAIANSYYGDNISLIENELKAKASYIAPSSQKSVPENAEFLYKKLLNLHSIYQKQITLFGHSKGGAEILYMCLIHPELFTNKIISQVVLIQAAIGGSPLVERAEGCWANLAISLLSPNLSTLFPEVAHNNFRSAFITYKLNLKLIASSLAKTPETLHDEISSRIFYVRSFHQGEINSLGLNIVLGILQDSLDDEDILHDALMPLDGQMHKDIGILWGTLECHHAALTISEPLSGVPAIARKAFMRMCFRKLQAAREKYGQ
jgi:pimeloyl-ACP methyl ester carboxylesterase